MNQAQLQSELTKSIAENLGYTGPISGFQKFIMSNQPASQRYAGILKAIDISKNTAKKKAQRQTGTPMPQMAEGGMPMRRFDQRQETEGVGAFVPPPMQSFQVGGMARTNQVPRDVGFGDTVGSDPNQLFSIPPEQNPELTLRQGPALVTTPTNQPPAQKFDKVKRAKVDTR